MESYIGGTANPETVSLIQDYVSASMLATLKENKSQPIEQARFLQDAIDEKLVKKFPNAKTSVTIKDMDDVFKAPYYH